MTFRTAIVGATGAVGRAFLQCLEARKFPIGEIDLLASSRSLGKVLHFNGKPCRVQELTQSAAAKKYDFVFMSAGRAVSETFAPLFVKAGATVIDNSSAWRMHPDIPLIVPEVNADRIPQGPGIIANPNCSTIQLVVALKPIHDAARVNRVTVSTYQAASGAGEKGRLELEDETRSRVLDDRLYQRKVFPRSIAFNVIPQIDVFQPDGYTFEERKMMTETLKILGDPTIRVSATCVRVPVLNGHSESVQVETERKLSAPQAVELWKKASGVIVSEQADRYPTPAEVSGRDEVFVGRVREDLSLDRGLSFWVVADNIRKGAALNAVQIAERRIR